MAEIDKAAAALSPSTSYSKSPSSSTVSTCFLCGENSPTLLPSLSQGRRHYMRQVELFQGYLNDDDNLHLSTSSSTAEGMGDSGNSKNIETCANCLKEIKEVWDLNQQIEAIREDISTIVERVAAAMPQRKRGISKPKPHKNTFTTRKAKSKQSRRKAPEPDLDLNAMLAVEVKQEVADVKEEMDDHWSEFEDNDVMDEGGSCFEMLAINPDQQNKDDLAEPEIPSSSSPSKYSRPKRQSRIVAEEILQRKISSENDVSENELDSANNSDTDESSNSEEDDDDSESKVTGQNNTSTICSHCGKVFANQSSLRLHIRRVHLQILSHQCDQCDRSFSCFSDLTQHTKFNHSGETFTCSACNKVLASQRRWAVHEALVCKVPDWGAERLKNEFNIILLPCPHPGCDKQFDRENQVARHLLTHTKARPYSCPSCGKSYTQKTNLNHHISKICPNRGDVDNNSASATRNLVSVGANVLCDVCGVSMRPSQLKIHMQRVHEGLRNNACPKCGKCFHKAYDRNRHVATVHATPEEKINAVKYPCEECGQEFRHRPSLYGHVARVHRGGGGENAKKHGCSKCPRRFYKRADLIRHENRHASSGWWCFGCGKNFSGQRELEEHQEKLDGGICEPNYRDKPKRPKMQEGVEIDEAVRGIVDQDMLQQV